MREYGSVEKVEVCQGVAYVRYQRVQEAAAAFEASARVFALFGSPQGFRVYFSDPERRAGILPDSEREADLSPYVLVSYPPGNLSDLQLLRRDANRAGDLVGISTRRPATSSERTLFVFEFKRSRSALSARREMIRHLEKKVEVAVLAAEDICPDFKAKHKSKKAPPPIDYSVRPSFLNGLLDVSPRPYDSHFPPGFNPASPHWPSPTSTPYHPSSTHYRQYAIKPIRASTHHPGSLSPMSTPLAGSMSSSLASGPLSSIAGTMGGGGMAAGMVGPMGGSMGSMGGGAMGGSMGGSMGGTMGSSMGTMGSLGSGAISNPMGTMNSMGGNLNGIISPKGGSNPMGAGAGGSMAGSMGYSPSSMMGSGSWGSYGGMGHMRTGMGMPLYGYEQESKLEESEEMRSYYRRSEEESRVLVWTGNLTRSKQHSVNVELYLVEGQRVDIREGVLNITHRQSYEVALKRKALAVCVMQPSALVFREKFEDYIKYLSGKKRAGVAFTQEFRMHVLPTSEVTDCIHPLRPHEMLALIWPRGDEPSDPIQS